MARLITVFAALSALVPLALTAPQLNPPVTQICKDPVDDNYEVTDVSKPYYTKAEPVGGSSCRQGDGNVCQHQKGHQHSVGVTESVSGGVNAALDIGKIFNIGASAGYEYSWSKEDAVSISTYATCPDPDKGSYLCGLQVKPKKVKTKGKVHRWFPEGMCANPSDPDPVDFEIEAPAMSKGGPNEDSNVLATFEACIISCPDNPDSLDCDGVKSVEGKLPLCPETKTQHSYEPGWCTAHITQHQRWQGAVGNKFKFSLRMYDGDDNEFYNQLYQEVNDDGVLSVKSLLPKTLEIKAGSEDNDDVEICYRGECFRCDGDDGGDHDCTLGNGKEHGYEDNKRQGDFGFTC